MHVGKGCATVALLALALFAAACGGTEVLDTQDVAAQLSDSLSSQANGNVSVDCPEDIPIEEGNSFTCTATAPDETFDIVVTQTDSQGNVTTRRASLNMGAVEAQISDSLEQMGGIPIEVECPDDAEVGEGIEFECVASSELGELVFIVTQTDDFGNVLFRAKPEKDK